MAGTSLNGAIFTETGQFLCEKEHPSLPELPQYGQGTQTLQAPIPCVLACTPTLPWHNSGSGNAPGGDG